MSNKCPTCSQTGVERSNPQDEARCGEPASRNAIELDSASLHKVGAANLPDWTKPAIIGEAALECSRWAPRGDWSQRVGKEKSSKLGDPARAATLRRKSDGLIVAGKGLISPEPRGPTAGQIASVEMEAESESEERTQVPLLRAL